MKRQDKLKRLALIRRRYRKLLALAKTGDQIDAPTDEPEQVELLDDVLVAS